MPCQTQCESISIHVYKVLIVFTSKCKSLEKNFNVNLKNSSSHFDQLTLYLIVEFTNNDVKKIQFHSAKKGDKDENSVILNFELTKDDVDYMDDATKNSKNFQEFKKQVDAIEKSNPTS